MVQDLATQWIQSYPCKTKTSQETERSLQKFLEPTRKPKVIYTDNSLEFGKACEDLAWNHCTSTRIAQKHTELQNELYDESKKERQPCYYDLDWMKSGGQIIWYAVAICEMSKTSWQTGKLLMDEDLGNHSKDRLFDSVHW